MLEKYLFSYKVFSVAIITHYFDKDQILEKIAKDKNAKVLSKLRKLLTNVRQRCKQNIPILTRLPPATVTHNASTL